MARKILLADDSVTAQNMGRKILADAGYEVATVNNGSAALKRIAEFKPDLIVLDVYMPGYSGLEVCQRLKDADETTHIPVLLTVGKLEPFKPEEARRVKADAHIVKPFEASELLTAITELEERMVTLPVASVRSAAFQARTEQFRPESNYRKPEPSVADTSWKSRLGFSSKKKKEEVEDTSDNSFRDFRKGKRKPAAAAAAEKQAPKPEAVTLPEIPRDITPEELNVLSALAAKLDRSIPVSKVDAPAADAPAAKAPEAFKTEINEPAATAATPVVEVEATAAESFPVTAEQRVEPNAETAQAEAGFETKVETKSEAASAQKTEQPSQPEPLAPVVESTVTTTIETDVAAPPVIEAIAAPSETVDKVVADPVGAAAVDQSPEFVVEGRSEIEIPAQHVELTTEAVAAVEGSITNTPEPPAPELPAAELSVDESHEVTLSETLSNVLAATVNPALLAEEPACVDQADEPMFASTPTAEPPTAELAVQEAEEETGEGAAPSDAELFQALRLLTPASWNAAAAAQGATPHTTSDSSTAGTRWIAEPVALTPEEAAMSLEMEMFGAVAAAHAEAPATESSAAESLRVDGVSAIAAAVEIRLPEAELATSTPTAPEHADSHPSTEGKTAEHSIEGSLSTQDSSAAAQPLQDKLEAGPASADPIHASTAEVAAIASETETAAPANADAAQNVSSSEGATAAVAAHQDTAPAPAEISALAEVAKAPEQNLDSASVTTATAATVEEHEVASPDSANQSSSKESVTLAPEISGALHAFTSPDSAAAQSAVEAAISAHTAEEVPKAKAAAAAAADGGVSIDDASTIANIVESVLADLRPKLVEEIAKKLAKK